MRLRPIREPVYEYRPALDGVRALAVAAVVLFHAGVSFLPGGFLGVDAFFVLSGFLITSLLLAEHTKTGRIVLAAFWGRRARRLLPALLVVLVAVAIAGRYLLPDVEVKLLRWDALAALAYVANWRMIFRGSDYFAQTAAPSPLQHTWSLGIEEQFYLLWPLIVVGLLAMLGRRRARAGLLFVCVLGAGVSAVLCALLYRPDDVNRAYFGTDTRAQALLIGCALAVLAAPKGHREAPNGRHPLLGALALIGAGWIGWMWTHADGTSGWLYRGGLTAGALSVGLVITHSVLSPRSPTARLLSLPPLLWLGRISYGVYLWHWPLFQFVNAERTGVSGPALLGLRCALTLAVSIVSYWLVERPIRRGRWLRRLPRPVPIGAAVASMTLVGVVAVVATVPPAGPSGSAFAAPPPIKPPSPSAGRSLAPPPTQRPGRKPGAQPRITFFGDSVAWTLGTYMTSHPGVTITTRAIQGCGVNVQPDILELGTPHSTYSYCPGWPSRWQNGINIDDPDVSVILLNRWELMDTKLNGVYTHVGNPDFNQYLGQKMDTAIAIAGSRGARVVLLTAAYTHRSETPSGGLYAEDQPSRVDAWNALLRKEITDHPNVTLIDLNKLVCPGGKYTASVNGLQIRSDGLHFTPAGVQRLITPWLLPQLTALATNGAP